MLEELLIKIKAISDMGGIDDTVEKIHRLGDSTSYTSDLIKTNFENVGEDVKNSFDTASKGVESLGVAGVHTFEQIRYASDSSLKGINDAIDNVKFDKLLSQADSVFGNISRAGSEAFSSVNNDANSLGSTISGIWDSIKSSAASTWDSVKDAAGSAWDSIKDGAASMADSISGAFEQAKQAGSNFMSSMQGMQGMVMGVLGGLGVNSVYDKIFGTGMKVETNQIIVDTMAQTAKGSTELYNAVDKATDKYLMSMQSVIPAMNAFKSSTGANETQLKNAATAMSSFGSQVLLLTNSEALAETAMYDLSKGLEGSFLTLRRYGVTKESLLATGKWTGEAKDIEGYLAAIEEVAGMDPRMMETTQGVITSIGKQFSVAGKNLAKDLLPYLKQAATWFYETNKALGGGLAKGILAFVGAISGLAVIGGVIGLIKPLIDGIRGIGKVADVAKNGLSALTKGSDLLVHSAQLAKNTALLKANTKALKENNVVRTIQNRNSTTPTSFKDTIKGDLKKIGRGAIGAAVGIAAGMALATEALILMQAPMWALANLGKSFKANEPSIKAGVEAFKIVGTILAFALPPIIAFTYLMGVTGNSAFIALAVGSVGAAAGIAIAMLLVTEALLLLNLPLLSIGLLGAVFQGIETQVRKGIEAIKLVADTLMEIAPVLVLFGAAVLVFSIVPLAGLYAATGIAITIALATESILLLEAPLKKVAELGGKFSDLTGIRRGIDAIKSAMQAVKMIQEIYDVAKQVSSTTEFKITGNILTDIVSFIKAATDDQVSLNSLVDVMSQLETFVNKFNEVSTTIPKIENKDALTDVGDVIKDVSTVVTNVNEGLEGINKMNDLNKPIKVYTGPLDFLAFFAEGKGPFEKLGDIVEGTANFIKNTQGTITNIPKIDSKKLEGLKSAVSIISEISNITTKMSDALKNIVSMKQSNMQASSGDGSGPFDQIGKIVDGVINFMKHNKGKLEGMDTEEINEAGSKFRKLTSSFNYFLNDAVSISSRLNTLKGIDEPDWSLYERLERFVNRVIITMKNLKEKMGEKLEVNDIGTKFRQITDQFGFFVNDANKISNSLNDLGKIDEPDWSLFGRIETITGRVITAMTKIKEKMDGAGDFAGIGEKWRNNISSEFMYFANDFNTITQAMEKIGDEPIDYEKFTALEITIGRVITSLQTIAGKVKDSGINDDGGAAGISAAVQVINDTITSINTALNTATGVETASFNLGAKIPAGIKKGVNGTTLGSEIISTITTAINSGNGHFTNSGKRLGTSLANGFRSAAIQLKTIAGNEANWAVNAINTKASAMWTAGSKLGSSLVRGFRDGLNQSSPGDAAKAAAAEAEFINEAFTNNYSTLYNIGKGALDSVSAGFGSGINSGSPGDLAKAASNEMGFTLSALSSKISTIYETGKQLGNALVEGFGNPTLAQIENEGFEEFENPYYERSNYNPKNYDENSTNSQNGDTYITKNSFGDIIIKATVRDDDDIDAIEYKLEALLDRYLRTA